MGLRAGIAVKAERARRDDRAEASLRRMLPRIGECGDFSLTPLQGGGNNRVYRVTGLSRPMLLKQYADTTPGGWDRLRCEYAFLQFADEANVAAPRPIAASPEDGCALYEYVEGRSLGPDEVNAGHVAQAITFIERLNAHRAAPAAQRLGMAAEACFTVKEHLECVERRVQVLAATAVDPTTGEAGQFLHQTLAPAWRRIRAVVQQAASGHDARPLAPDNRVISPSDFGFHNALERHKGELRFLDFEYAGWDDPAKLICDFFCQVRIPAPSDCWGPFVDAIARLTTEPEACRSRAAWLLPVYRIKWCCIVLGVLREEVRRRREFAGEQVEASLEEKLELARGLHALAMRELTTRNCESNS